MSLGSVDAIYNIGTIYEAGCSNLSGVILNKDLDAAIRFYTKAANKDCVKAQFRLATLLICEPALQDYETAVKYLLKAACPESVPESPSQVSPLAASPLDTAFQPTSTVSVVPKERIDAMNLIGELLELGQGDPDQVPDPQSAIVWYKRALKHGHARAAFNLGSLFERGVGIERDLSRAAKLYEEAARRGNWEATERLEELKSLDVLPPSS